MSDTMLEESDYQAQDEERREQEIVAILKRVDMGMADHDDVMFLASSLGVAKYFLN
ncbi:MAG TPA: hypothetical protein VIY48_11245 [Candidatus Paceibacterota bacterium]